MITFKQFVEEGISSKPVGVRDADGSLKHIKNVNIRMADGTIRSLPPGKSGSSSGGDE